MLSIEAKQLTKIYETRGGWFRLKPKPESEPNKEFAAVSDLSFEIKKGEAVAFLGPNGAGKSTTIKMLCGILSPTSGTAMILEHPAGSSAASQKLGLVFGTRSQLYLHMTVAQCLSLIGEIYRLSGKEKSLRIHELSELFEIRSLLDARVRTLSLGQRMRCELVASLIHRPEVLLADEPTIGLDVVVKNKLRELIARWQREEKTTLLLTSHDLSDVEALCDRCILIDHGRKTFDGRLDAVKGDLAEVRRVQVTVSSAEIPALPPDPRIRTLKLEDGEERSAFVHGFEFSLSKISMGDALSRLSNHYGSALQDIRISEVTLEEVLGKLYSGRTQDG